MKLFLGSLLLCPAVVAFTTNPSSNSFSTVLRADISEEEAAPVAAKGMNGWIPDSKKFAWGLPGSIDPIENFDPFGFATDCDLDTMRRYREAETTHGRVAMLAVIGFLIQEAGFHPLFNQGGADIGPAIRHLDEVRAEAPFFFELIAILIGSAEVNRALNGWEKPGDAGGWPGKLRQDYFPGDIGFDPLGLKPGNFDEFAEISTKELQNGRVAMLAAAGFVAQQLANEKSILDNIGSLF